MENYQNIGGDSGVAAYEIGQSMITIRFLRGGVYQYTALSAGQNNIDEMARLARAGHGLNSFINSNVRDRYSRKLT